MDKMMAGIGAQLRAIGPALQTLPKPPYIALSAQGTTAVSALSGIYVPIYMHQYLHYAADASKGGVVIFALVKGPVNQERDTASSDIAQKGPRVTYTTGLFGVGYPPSYPPKIIPPFGVRDPQTGAPSRDLRREPALIVTIEFSAVRKITVDLGLGVAIGATAKPALVMRYESFNMDAQSWWAAKSGVKQKLTSGTISLSQDMVEMRDLRDGAPQPSWPLGWPGSNETLTLNVQTSFGKIVPDFSGKYVPVRYSKRQDARLGGGSFVQLTMLNMDSGGPRTESLVKLDMRKQGEENLHDHRYFAVIPGGTEIVPIRGKMNPGSAGIPCVTLEVSLDSQGLIKDGTMGFTRMGADMRLTGFIAAVRFDESAMRAAESTGHTISHYGWKLNVKANRAKIIR